MTTDARPKARRTYRRYTPTGSAETLRAILRREIAAQGYTQSELAHRCGVSQSCLSRLLTGAAGASLDVADRVLTALGRRLVLTTEDR